MEYVIIAALALTLLGWLSHVVMPSLRSRRYVHSLILGSVLILVCNAGTWLLMSDH